MSLFELLPSGFGLRLPQLIINSCELQLVPLEHLVALFFPSLKSFFSEKLIEDLLVVLRFGASALRPRAAAARLPLLTLLCTVGPPALRARSRWPRLLLRLGTGAVNSPQRLHVAGLAVAQASCSGVRVLLLARPLVVHHRVPEPPALVHVVRLSTDPQAKPGSLRWVLRQGQAAAVLP